MDCKAEVTVDCGSPEAARRARDSLAPDDDGHVTTSVDGATLAVEVTADGPGSLRAALDDVLACLDVARDVDDVADDAGSS
jgi:tRNA threonylcarbamoyladenosine modification (KEOPS) complex  Pcc1 subunit